jgi:hypothetical protein
MIRKARLEDREAILGLIRPYFKLYPLKPDHQKIADNLREIVSSPQHFAWVATDEGGLVGGVLLGYTGENLWSQRKGTQVAAWISKVPMEGLRLLLKFTEWADDRPVVKFASFTPDIDLGIGRASEAWSLAERAGFKWCGGSYIRYKGGLQDGHL